MDVLAPAMGFQVVLKNSFIEFEELEISDAETPFRRAISQGGQRRSRSADSSWLMEERRHPSGGYGAMFHSEKPARNWASESDESDDEQAEATVEIPSAPTPKADAIKQLQHKFSGLTESTGDARLRRLQQCGDMWLSRPSPTPTTPRGSGSDASNEKHLKSEGRERILTMSTLDTLPSRVPSLSSPPGTPTRTPTDSLEDEEPREKKAEIGAAVTQSITGSPGKVTRKRNAATKKGLDGGLKAYTPPARDNNHKTQNGAPRPERHGAEHALPTTGMSLQKIRQNGRAILSSIQQS